METNLMLIKLLLDRSRIKHVKSRTKSVKHENENIDWETLDTGHDQSLTLHSVILVL